MRTVLPLIKKISVRPIQLDMEGPLVFVHIPKTAGTTFNSILEERYFDRPVFKVDDMESSKSLDHFKALSKKERARYDLIQGHRTLEILPFIPENATYITFLRDPVDQVISSFNHQKNTPENLFYQEVQEIERLDEYLEFRKTKGIDNIQARHLGGGLHHHDRNSRFIDMDEEGEDILRRALSHLRETFSLVLLTEAFDTSLIMLQRELGWDRPLLYRKKNISKKSINKGDLDQKTFEQIRSFYAYDVELHQNAKELFAQKKEELLGGKAEQMLKRFRRKKAVHHWWFCFQRAFQK